MINYIGYNMRGLLKNYKVRKKKNT